MSKKILLRPGSSLNRRQPLLQQSNSSRKARTRLGEAVGGTAAVCCCCPAVVANVVFLAIYKFPATLCRRVLEKKQKRRRSVAAAAKEGLLQTKRRWCTCGCCDDVSIRVYPTCGGDDDVADVRPCNDVGEKEKEDKGVMELEKEMWDRFQTTGFWRSPSQRDSTRSSQWITGSVSVPNLEVFAPS